MALARPLRPAPKPPRHRAAFAAVSLAVLAVHLGLLLAADGLHWAVPTTTSPQAPPRSVTLAPVRLPTPTPTPAAQPAAETPPTPKPKPRPSSPATRTEAVAPLIVPAPGPAGDPAEDAAPPLPDVASLPTELPPLNAPQALTLRYRAERGSGATAIAGSALLKWDTLDGVDGPAYALQWQLTMDNGRGEQDWSSTGTLGAAGVLPQRMVERRRGRDQSAVNFQRERQLISFSGPRGTQTLTPGAQDRASWLVQLPLLAGAVGGGWTPGAQVTVPVATVRGELGFWSFEVVGEEALTLPGQPAPVLTWHLLREPQRPYDQRIEVWLARERQWQPAQLRFTPVPGDAPLTLTVTDGLPPPAPPLPASTPATPNRPAAVAGP